MNSWLAFLITLSVIIFVHELGHFLMARIIGVKVERFSLGFGPRLLRVKPRETEYCLSLFPFGGYVKMAGESAEIAPSKPYEYRARTVWERFSIVFAGPFINYLVGFGLFVLIFWVGAPVLSTRVGQVLEGYPAASAGVKPGDRILAVNGKSVNGWEEMTQQIHSQTQSVRLTVERAGSSFTLSLRPKVNETTNLLGARVRIGMVGITPSDEIQSRRYPLPQAVFKAGQRVWSLTHLTLQALWRIVTGGLSVKESMTGPIGIFYITSAVAEQGLISLLQLIAVLSTSLGLFNLLPIPVLDGGHLLFLVVERFKGKPISSRVQEVMTQVGLGLLVLLLLVVTYNDFEKFQIAKRFLPFLGKD